MRAHNGMPATELGEAAWRKSRYSGPQGGNCVEVASLPTGETALRNSRDPDGPALLFTRSAVAAFLDGIRAGEFDHLA